MTIRKIPANLSALRAYRLEADPPDISAFEDFINQLGCTMDQFLGKSRKRVYTEIRFVIRAWYVVNFPDVSYQMLANISGTNDHTDMIYACGIVSELIEFGHQPRIVDIFHKIQIYVAHKFSPTCRAIGFKYGQPIYGKPMNHSGSQMVVGIDTIMQVCPESVRQFTGFRHEDKADMIFEGDYYEADNTSVCGYVYNWEGRGYCVNYEGRFIYKFGWQD